MLQLFITLNAHTLNDMYFCMFIHEHALTAGCCHLILYVYTPSTDPPKVLSFTPTNTTVVAGSTVTLNCSYEGNPSPTVSWSHNETMLDIENDPNLSEIYNDGYALLEMTFVDINNTGVYKCEIDSIFGMDSSELQGMNT